jgi:hypothetical protein
MQQRQVSLWASSKLYGIGLKFGGLIGDDEKCASRGVMGDNERVMSKDAFSIDGGGGGTLGGGDKWVLI